MNTKIIYCNNCGNEGHLYRHCRLPVLSYGILCINTDKLLMIQRKDSLSYIEFLRGKYELSKPDYIFQLLNTCSLKERQLISELSLDELWERLWFSGKTKKKQTDRMIKEYEKSKYLFGQLQQTILHDLLERCNKTYETPEWEFPKGRRNNHESNCKCAIREFEEETDVLTKDYILLENVVPLSEEYTGSNGVRYKHIYYVAFYKGETDLSINKDKYEQYSEIGDIQWLTMDQCLSKIRPEQITKKDIIHKIQAFMENYTSDFTLKE